MRIGQYVGLSHIFDIEIKVEPKQRIKCSKHAYWQQSGLCSKHNNAYIQNKAQCKYTVQLMGHIVLVVFSKILIP